MDPRKRQTATATPAEPGELLWILGMLLSSDATFTEATLTKLTNAALVVYF